MTDLEEPDRLQDLPPSAKLVHKVLEYEGELTKKQLIEHTRLTDRTITYALKQLEETGAISKRHSLRDARQSLYRLRSHE